jgi:hypothetical protein
MRGAPQSRFSRLMRRIKALALGLRLVMSGVGSVEQITTANVMSALGHKRAFGNSCVMCCLPR